MTDWTAVPTFGSRDEQLPHVVRPSAYGLIVDPGGRLAIVHTPVGVYLPGGGMFDAESPESAVSRETREECGLATRVGTWRRMAIEHVAAPREHTHFEKRSTFCDAIPLASTSGRTELDHRLTWVSPDEALRLLNPASHRWAVTEWLTDFVRPSRPAV